MTKFHMRRDYAQGGRAAAGDGAASAGRQGGLGGVPRRAGAVARRSRRRGDRRLPQGRRASSRARATRPRRSTCRAGSTTTAAAFARACRRCRRRSITSAQARSPTTPPGAWRSRTSCSATPPRRPPGSSATRACRRPASRPTSAPRGRLLARALPRQARHEGGPTADGRSARGVPRAGPPRAALFLRPAGARRASGGRPGVTGDAAARRRSPAWPRGKAARDPTSRARPELADAGLDAEAGDELHRDEKGMLAARGRREGGTVAAGALPTRRRTFTAPTSLPSRTTAARWPPIRSRRRACASSGRRPSRAPTPPLVDRYGPPAGNPELLPLRDHAQGVGLRSARRLVRRRARPAADDPAHERARRREGGRAVRARRALRAGDQHPPGRALHRRAVQEVRRRDPAGGGRLQRGAARDGEVVHAARQRTPPTSSSSSSRSRRRASTPSASPLYAHYRYLYGPKPYEIPLTLNTKVSPDGPDY